MPDDKHSRILLIISQTEKRVKIICQLNKGATGNFIRFLTYSGNKYVRKAVAWSSNSDFSRLLGIQYPKESYNYFLPALLEVLSCRRDAVFFLSASFSASRICWLFLFLSSPSFLFHVFSDILTLSASNHQSTKNSRNEVYASRQSIFTARRIFKT